MTTEPNPRRVRLTTMRGILAAFALMLAAGCATASTRPSANGPGPTPPGVGTVAPAQATFTLTVSNQSFIDERAKLTVAIDGDVVVSAPFDVGGQHSFYDYSLALAPGDHVLTANAPHGTRMTKTFTVPARGRTYGTLLYWNYEDEGPRLDFEQHETPPAFG